MKHKKTKLKEAAGTSNHQRDKQELADMERRKDYAACAMVEAESMIHHWTRKRDEARAVFNANLVQYVMKKYSKQTIEQMVRDGFAPNLKEPTQGGA